jgi:hypothetical protein
MFWREKRSLSAAPLYGKLAITLVLLISGIGYLLGFANIYLTYSPTDEKPGLSIADVRIAFYGARNKTVLEGAIDGSMKEYFPSEQDYQATKQWIAAGATEQGFERVRPIFEQSCDVCHSADMAVGDVVLVTYQDTGKYLQQDTGKSVNRLVALSHTHLLPTLSAIFILVFIFSFSRYADWAKGLVMVLSLLAIVADIGSWWLAKFFAWAAPLVILGGISLALSFAVLIVLSLVDMWFLPEEC